MESNILSIIDSFQNELDKTNVEDFYIIRYDRSGKLILAGSFDFCYYHNVEIIFHDVSFICCPSSTFTVNRLRIADESEIQELHQMIHGYQKDGFAICMEDTFSNTSYYIIAHDIEYKFQKVNYYCDGKIIKGEVISDWAKEKCLLNK